MAINSKLLAGPSCAAFISGILLGAAVLFLYLHIRRPRNISSTLAPSPSTELSQPLPRIKPNWWFPQPEGFDLKEHNIITALDSATASIRCHDLQSAISSFSISVQWKDLSDSTLRTLANDALAAVILRTGYEPHSSSSSSFTAPSFALHKRIRIPDWPAVASLLAKLETRQSGLIHLLSLLIFPNISLDGSGPADWNLLSPHLAGLAQEIAESRKQEETTDPFYIWAWEKLRIYTLINLYPSIFPKSVLEHQNKQPTTRLLAIARLESFLVDLLTPYIDIKEDEVQALRSMLQRAGRLGVCIYKGLQPLGWNWETCEKGIPLFPAFEIIGDSSGVRRASKDACKILGLQVDHDYNMAGEFLGKIEDAFST